MILALLLQEASSPTITGPMIGGGAIALSGGGALVKYALGRFSRLEDRVSDTSEDLAAIMGHLGIERPARRR